MIKLWNIRWYDSGCMYRRRLRQSDVCVGGLWSRGAGSVNERIARCEEIGSDGCIKNIRASFITVRTRIHNALC